MQLKIGIPRLGNGNSLVQENLSYYILSHYLSYVDDTVVDGVIIACVFCVESGWSYMAASCVSIQFSAAE